MNREPCLIASVHDVMPETLSRVEHLTARLENAGLQPVLLLVVPGRNWQEADLARLRTLAGRGHELAGHGWHHAIEGYRNIYHRLHGLLLSRRAAEHLALDGKAIADLIRACRRWFDRHDLPAPRTYVPPAWAIGTIGRHELANLGFRYYETLTGIYDVETDRMQRLPLLGFEADTKGRRTALRASNALNLLLARCTGRARLAIHPYDAELLLADDLDRWLAPAGKTVIAPE